MPHTPNNTKLGQSIKDTYMRGFRMAVNGEDPGPLHPESHLARGHAFGAFAVSVARSTAKDNADRVLNSAAMTQAQENAESGQRVLWDGEDIGRYLGDAGGGSDACLVERPGGVVERWNKHHELLTIDDVREGMHGPEVESADILHEKYPPLPNTHVGRDELKGRIIEAVRAVLPPVEPFVEFDEPTKEQIERRELSGTMGVRVVKP